MDITRHGHGGVWYGHTNRGVFIVLVWWYTQERASQKMDSIKFMVHGSADLDLNTNMTTNVIHRILNKSFSTVLVSASGNVT